MKRLSASDIVLKVLGLLLLTAAVLKGHELLTVPTANRDLWSWRPFLIFQVEFELALGTWLLSGLFTRLAWLAALTCFNLFCCVTLYKALTGATSCGCFGTVPVSPWTTLAAIDPPAALALFRPDRSVLPLLSCLRRQEATHSVAGRVIGRLPPLPRLTAVEGLAVLIMLQCAAPNSAADTVKPEIQQITDALRSLEPEGPSIGVPRAWPEDILNEFAHSIVDLANHNYGGLSSEQVTDICAGIANLQQLYIITEASHPLRKDMVKEELLHRVCTYLEYGHGNPNERKRLSEQIEWLTAQFGRDLRAYLPQDTDTIERALREVSSKCMAWIDNPLMTSFKKPFRDSDLSDMREILRERMQSFTFTEATEGPQAAAYRTFELVGVINKVLGTRYDATRTPMLPVTEALSSTQQEFFANHRTIIQYESAAREEYALRQRQELRRRQLSEDYGLDDQLYLDFIQPGDVSWSASTTESAAADQNERSQQGVVAIVSAETVSEHGHGDARRRAVGGRRLRTHWLVAIGLTAGCLSVFAVAVMLGKLKPVRCVGTKGGTSMDP